MRDQPTLRHPPEALAPRIHRRNETVSVSVVESGGMAAMREEMPLERDQGAISA